MNYFSLSKKIPAQLIIAVIVPFLFLTGFDVSRHSIPGDEIHDGGPPKDGIPALYDPEFIYPGGAIYQGRMDERVLGIDLNGESKAYPIRILNWHELVNDTVGGRPILISYCPLCGTGMIFDAEIKGERRLFGVSGKLYNSNVLFYDKGTESLWSQIKMEAVTGPMTGTKLKLLAVEHTTWGAWKAKYPDTKILSANTGYKRDYTRDPYGGYENNRRLYFPVNNRDSRLHEKAWVVGVVVNGDSKAYPFGSIKEQHAMVNDVVGGQDIRIEFDIKNRSAVVRDHKAKIIPSVQIYWFAWSAFYPDTKIYKPEETTR